MTNIQYSCKFKKTERTRVYMQLYVYELVVVVYTWSVRGRQTVYTAVLLAKFKFSTAMYVPPLVGSSECTRRITAVRPSSVHRCTQLY